MDSQFKCAYFPESTYSFLKEWMFHYGRHGKSGELLQEALSRIGLYVLSDELQKKFDNKQGTERIFFLLGGGGGGGAIICLLLFNFISELEGKIISISLRGLTGICKNCLITSYLRVIKNR